jgi:crotonobetainyl-CoA:carnitine CoA-transferase CaiB-like acyl-CoA transferase
LASEQTSARQMLVEIPTADGTIRGVGNPIRIDGWQAEYRVPPLLGEHAALLLQTSSGGN